MEYSFVLVRPQFEGNVGAVARVMANFGFSQLVLVDPQCDHRGTDCRNRAKHAQRILDSAVVISSLQEVQADYLVATSGKLGSDYNIPRLPMSVEQLAKKFSGVKTSCAIVFGPESSGLLNEELSSCDLFVSIPTDESYPIMNLSHSVAIIAYELGKMSHSQKQYRPISAKDKEVLVELFDETIAALSFDTPQKAATQGKLWRRIISKALLTKREAFAVMGFLKAVLKRR